MEGILQTRRAGALVFLYTSFASQCCEGKKRNHTSEVSGIIPW